LLASGAIGGGIFAGYFSKVVTKNFGTESLLLGMATFLLACLPLVLIICRRHQELVPDAELTEEPVEQGPRNLRESMALVSISPYLRAIATLIGVSALVTENLRSIPYSSQNKSPRCRLAAQSPPRQTGMMQELVTGNVQVT
jgi:ATP/ADP translocase